MLRHPCTLRDPQRQARGPKSQVATLPLPSQGPKRGQKCYVTPAFLGVLNTKRADRYPKWLPHRCLLEGAKEGGNQGGGKKKNFDTGWDIFFRG